MSKESMIETILRSGETAAENIESAARADAADLLARAEKDAADKRARATAAAEESARLTRARKVKIAELDAGKVTLAARRQLIGRAYGLAAERIAVLPDDEYRTFFGALVRKYAEPGDRVIVSARDRQRLDKDWLAAVRADVTLVLSETDFMGGVILSNGVCDKNLTIETLVDESRAATETHVAALLEI